MISKQLLAFIGRRIPAIYDVIPRGPLRVVHVAGATALARRGEEVELNPQPLPPLEAGALAATEILRLGWFAEQLGVKAGRLADWDGDLCPKWPKWPKLPPHVGPVPDPEPHPEWLLEYHLGLVTTLAVAAETFGKSALGESALELSLASLEAGLEATAGNG